MIIISILIIIIVIILEVGPQFLNLLFFSKIFSESYEKYGKTCSKVRIFVRFFISDVHQSLFFIWLFGFRGGQNMYPKPYEVITRCKICNSPAWAAAAYLGGTEELWRSSGNAEKNMISEKTGYPKISSVAETPGNYNMFYMISCGFIWFYVICISGSCLSVQLASWICCQHVRPVLAP